MGGRISKVKEEVEEPVGREGDSGRGQSNVEQRRVRGERIHVGETGN